MPKQIRIGGASGFWGESDMAVPARVVSETGAQPVPLAAGQPSTAGDTGGTAALQDDPLGKAHAQILLDHPIPVPSHIAETL